MLEPHGVRLGRAAFQSASFAMPAMAGEEGGPRNSERGGAVQEIGRHSIMVA